MSTFFSIVFYPLVSATIKTVIAASGIFLIYSLGKRRLKARIRISLAWVFLLLMPLFFVFSFFPAGGAGPEFEKARDIKAEILTYSYVPPSLLETVYADVRPIEKPATRGRLAVPHPFRGVAVSVARGYRACAVCVWVFGVVLSLVIVVRRRMRLGTKIAGYAVLHDGPWFESLACAWERTGKGRMPELLDGKNDGPFLVRSAGRNAVVVPGNSDEWTVEERHLALLHECSHILRNDPPMMAIAEILASLSWHIPFARQSIRMIEAERECACDGMVLSAGADAQAYASLLLELTRRHGHIGMTPVRAPGIIGRTQIERRITAILQKERKTGALAAGLVSGAFCVLIACIVIFIPQLYAEQPPTAPPSDTRNSSRPRMLTVNTVTPYSIANRLKEEARIVTPEIFETNELPMASPVTGAGWTISQPFGTQVHPILRQLYIHSGIDIAGKLGAPVFSTMEGTIVRTGFQKNGYGRYVLLRKGKLMTAYMQLDEVHVTEGQSVACGTEIGTCGRSGLATGPHLHYEVFMVRDDIEQIDSKTELGYPGGVWLDPLPMIAATLF